MKNVCYIMNKCFTFSLLIFSLFAYNYTKAQKEANIWYFGDHAGIDFSSGSPVALTNSAMDVHEGCGTISDSNGNLLFYTDGITVWNKNHLIMSNGTGLNGNISAAQSGFIVQKPGINSSIYYVFSLDYEGNSGGLQYSIIDMALQGGLGEVITKNIQLVTPVIESITAIKHCNQTDIWLISHQWNSNSFYVYSITSSGLNTTPIINSVGAIHGGTVGNAVGAMKGCPGGNKLGITVRSIGSCEIFDFDNKTGAISNPISLPVIPGGGWPYGLEFCPQGSRMYFSKYGGTGGAQVYQVNLTAGSPTAIANSMTLVGTSASINAAALRLGPDGKIYLARRDNQYTGSPYLGVINNPSSLGIACNYVDNGFYLSGKVSRSGLPNFVQTSIIKPNHDFTYTDTCFSDITHFIALDTLNFDSAKWDFGDTTSGNSNLSDIFTPIHKFSKSGTFKVKLVVYRCGILDSIYKNITILPIPNLNLGNDTVICYEDSIVIDAGAGYVSYLWQDGSVNQSLTVDTQGLYWVDVTDTNGCKAVDTIIIGIYPELNLNIGNDTIVCYGDSIVIDAGAGYISYLWQDGSINQTLTVDTQGLYWVEITDTNGCKKQDTINVSEILPPIISLGNDTSICTGTNITFNVNVSYSNYLWQDGSINSSFTTSDSGFYWVMVSNICGSDTDTIFLSLKDCTPEIWVPNAFTPNGDGINDNFKAEGIGITKFEIYIYNRWGQLIFESNDIYKAWDGTYKKRMCQDGIYAWLILYEDILYNKQSMAGHVVLFH